MFVATAVLMRANIAYSHRKFIRPVFIEIGRNYFF